jgi:diketogulonate reductase-like aldo/keto reductase
VMAYTPLGDGSLVRRPRLMPDRGAKALQQVAADVDKTMAQVALNWCTAHANVIAIPKSNNLARTRGELPCLRVAADS